MLNACAHQSAATSAPRHGGGAPSGDHALEFEARCQLVDVKIWFGETSVDRMRRLRRLQTPRPVASSRQQVYCRTSLDGGRGVEGANGRVEAVLRTLRFEVRGLGWIGAAKGAIIAESVSSLATRGGAGSSTAIVYVTSLRSVGSPKLSKGAVGTMKRPFDVVRTSLAADPPGVRSVVSVPKPATNMGGIGMGATTCERKGCGQPKLCALGTAKAKVLLSTTVGQTGLGLCKAQVSGSVTVLGRLGPAGTTCTMW
jgi:hypothetical protein